ncbi:MAG: hypothetical protein LBP67_09410 [Bacteroidales bacterium]|jgi:hypothetical protein|nr:hypothetical protein [Bacteroidales bacterium]
MNNHILKKKALWERKHLSVTFLFDPVNWTELSEFGISKEYLDLISERLNMLELKPSSKKMKNKLMTKQYIQFEILPVPFYTKNFSTHRMLNISEPRFKKNNDAVVICLMLSVTQDENNYIQKFYDNLEIGIKEGLYKLSIYIDYLDSIFYEIRKENSEI